MDDERRFNLIDVHVHLEQFSDVERAGVLERARDAGVRWILTSGMDVETSRRAIQLADRHDGVFASVGMHPWNAVDEGHSHYQESIEALAKEQRIVGIGEVGLDFVDNVFLGVTFHDNPLLMKKQEEVLRWHVQLACTLKLPLLLHCRGAYSRLLTLLREEDALRVGGVIHNFNADMQTANLLMDMGFFLSFGGALTYPSAAELRKIAGSIPIDYILVETDSPYMPIYEQEMEKNEPANVTHVARILNRTKGMELDAFADALSKNFARLFLCEG